MCRQLLRGAVFESFKELFGLLSIPFNCKIACGQVVAGVVGTKRFLFDMWGDAVNVAARMEQHGLPGKIQVTKEVVDNVKSSFLFELRGTLNIKGKGMLDCYFLKSATDKKLRCPAGRRSQYNSPHPHQPLPARSDSTDI